MKQHLAFLGTSAHLSRAHDQGFLSGLRAFECLLLCYVQQCEPLRGSALPNRGRAIAESG